MATRIFITMLLSLMVNAVLFGAGAITVLSVPALNQQAMILLPAVIVVSLLITPLLSWLIAPRLRARYWHRPLQEDPAALGPLTDFGGVRTKSREHRHSSDATSTAFTWTTLRDDRDARRIAWARLWWPSTAVR